MGGSGPSSESGAAAELVAAPSADSSVDAAADMLGELSGWDTASHGDVFPDTGDSDALAIGEGLAAALEDIAAGPRRGAKGAKRSSPNATEEDDDEGLTSHHHNHSNRHRRHHHIIIAIAAYIIAIISVIIAVIIIITIKKGPKNGNDSTDSHILTP